MPDSPRIVEFSGPALNSAADGMTMAREVLALAREAGGVRLDVGKVERMTASFANALVMTLVEEMGEGAFLAKLSLVDAVPVVAREWHKALERYQRGIRLSTQRPGAA